MRAGALDRTIIIQRATYANNAAGEPVPTWSTLVTTRASKEDLSDGERWRAAEVAATVTCRFAVRWNALTSSVTPKDRILYAGRTYDISHVKELGRQVGLEITARARGDL